MSITCQREYGLGNVADKETGESNILKSINRCSCGCSGCVDWKRGVNLQANMTMKLFLNTKLIKMVDFQSCFVYNQVSSRIEYI